MSKEELFALNYYFCSRKKKKRLSSEFEKEKKTKMSEKKKLTVGVEAGASSPTGGAFDFSEFTEKFDNATGDSAVKRSAEGDGAPEYHTSYQCRKTSIAEGMTTDQLVDEHRKSIACLSVKEIGKTVDVHDLTGITLSKRHTLSQVEYEADLDAQAYTGMDGYAFGATLQAAMADDEK